MSEESARKARIRRQINEKRTIQRKCENVKAKLKKERQVQAAELSSWSRVYKECQSHSITSQVLIPNVFEGDCSRQTKRSFPQSVQLMDDTRGQAAGLLDDIDNQISRLDSYINQLENEIQRLYRQL